MLLSLVNGQEESHIPITDRALTYGDGVFETIAVEAGHICLWQEHLQRIRTGCAQLKIPFSQFEELEKEAQQLASASTDFASSATLKIIITAGSGERGYYRSQDTEPLRIVAVYPMDADTVADIANKQQQGIAATVCTTCLSRQPALAGLKHNNRLEQVLARSEWEHAYQEGVMLDDEGYVVEGTASNIFMLKNESLHTPVINACGVSGVMRGWIMEKCSALHITVEEGRYTLDDLYNSDGLFFTNSIIRAWPVHSLKDCRYDVAMVRAVLEKLNINSNDT